MYRWKNKSPIWFQLYRHTLCIILLKNIITWYLLCYCCFGLTQSQHRNAHYSVQNCEHWTHLPFLSYCMRLVCSQLQTFFISIAKRLRCNDNNRNTKCIHCGYIYFQLLNNITATTWSCFMRLLLLLLLFDCIHSSFLLNSFCTLIVSHSYCFFEVFFLWAITCRH